MYVQKKKIFRIFDSWCLSSYVYSSSFDVSIRWDMMGLSDPLPKLLIVVEQVDGPPYGSFFRLTTSSSSCSECLLPSLLFSSQLPPIRTARPFSTKRDNYQPRSELKKYVCLTWCKNKPSDPDPTSLLSFMAPPKDGHPCAVEEKRRKRVWAAPFAIIISSPPSCWLMLLLLLQSEGLILWQPY